MMNSKFVRVKGPTVISIPNDDGEDIPVIMDRHWMDPLNRLAKECNVHIKTWMAIEGDTDVLLEFDTSKQALVYALHYDETRTSPIS